MLTVNDMWEEYVKKVMPHGVHEVQYRETKRAFYAACYKMLVSTRDIAGHEDISEDDAIALLEGWENECLRHKDMVVAGLA